MTMTVSEAHLAGLTVRWPGPKGHPYPAIYRGGQRQPLADDRCLRHLELPIEVSLQGGPAVAAWCGRCEAYEYICPEHPEHGIQWGTRRA